jgi:hypothetical protein
VGVRRIVIHIDRVQADSSAADAEQIRGGLEAGLRSRLSTPSAARSLATLRDVATIRVDGGKPHAATRNLGTRLAQAICRGLLR